RISARLMSAAAVCRSRLATDPPISGLTLRHGSGIFEPRPSNMTCRRQPRSASAAAVVRNAREPSAIGAPSCGGRHAEAATLENSALNADSGCPAGPGRDRLRRCRWAPGTGFSRLDGMQRIEHLQPVELLRPDTDR